MYIAPLSKSLGFPIPYIHETEATISMSFLPERRAEVALNLNFSILKSAMSNQLRENSR